MATRVPKVTAGYKGNALGFGWTKGVFLDLFQGMPKEWQDRLTAVSKAQN